MDTETTSLDPMLARLVGISLAVTPHQRRLYSLGAPLWRRAATTRFGPSAGAAQTLAGKPAAAKLGQNLKYDMHVLANHGIRLQGVAHDTLLQSYVLEAHKPHDMDIAGAAPSRRTKPSATKKSPARAQNRSASTKWISKPPRTTRRKTPTSPCSCTRRCTRKSRAKPNWNSSTAEIEMPRARSVVRHRAQRRAAGQPIAGRPKP